VTSTTAPNDGAPATAPVEGVPDTDDALLAELGDVVVTLARHLQHEAHDAEGVVPLTGTEIVVLRWVDRHPGTTPTAVAEATGLRRSNLSAAVRSLVRAQMLVKEPDPQDSRLVHLRPTARAHDSSDRLRALWGGALADRLPPMDDEQRDVLVRALRILGAGEQ
jgi:DNA-binding MarR family transcriptional regulator